MRIIHYTMQQWKRVDALFSYSGATVMLNLWYFQVENANIIQIL